MSLEMRTLNDAGPTQLSVEAGSVDGVTTDDGSPFLFGPVWVAGAFGSVLLC